MANLLDGLDDADLVVDRHDRDERSGGTQRFLELLEVDQAVGLDGEVSDLEAFLLEATARVEHTLVLGLGGDNVVLFGLVEMGDTLDGHVVGLGGTRSEDDFFGVSANEIGNMFSTLLDPFFGLPAVGMGSRVRIAVLVGHVWHHLIHNARVDRRGGLCIKVDGTICCRVFGSRRDDVVEQVLARAHLAADAGSDVGLSHLDGCGHGCWRRRCGITSGLHTRCRGGGGGGGGGGRRRRRCGRRRGHCTADSDVGGDATSVASIVSCECTKRQPRRRRGSQRAGHRSRALYDA